MKKHKFAWINAGVMILFVTVLAVSGIMISNNAYGNGHADGEAKVNEELSKYDVRELAAFDAKVEEVYDDHLRVDALASGRYLIFPNDNTVLSRGNDFITLDAIRKGDLISVTYVPKTIPREDKSPVTLYNEIVTIVVLTITNQYLPGR